MRVRRSQRYSSLTSLVDVLFILLFASLVQQRRLAAATADAEPTLEGEPAEAAPPDAGVPPGQPDSEPAVDLHAAARAIAARLDTKEVVFVAVDADGHVISVESGDQTREVHLPLLRQTDDARVVVYDAYDNARARLCRVVASVLGRSDLDGNLVLVTTTRPIRELSYALVRGLRHDVSACPDDVGAYGLLVRAEPAMR